MWRHAVDVQFNGLRKGLCRSRFQLGSFLPNDHVNLRLLAGILQGLGLSDIGLRDVASHLEFFNIVDVVIEASDLGPGRARSYELRHWAMLALCEYLAMARRAPLVEAAHVWVVIDGGGADVGEDHQRLLSLASCISFL